jgi:hypothetical protein
MRYKYKYEKSDLSDNFIKSDKTKFSQLQPKFQTICRFRQTTKTDCGNVRCILQDITGYRLQLTTPWHYPCVSIQRSASVHIPRDPVKLTDDVKLRPTPARPVQTHGYTQGTDTQMPTCETVPLLICYVQGKFRWFSENLIQLQTRDVFGITYRQSLEHGKRELLCVFYFLKISSVAFGAKQVTLKTDEKLWQTQQR